MNVSEQHGAVPGAAQTDVAVNIDVRAAPLDSRAGRGLPVNIESKILQKRRTGNGRRHGIRSRRKERSQINALRKQQPLDLHVPLTRAAVVVPESSIVPPASQLMPAG